MIVKTIFSFANQLTNINFSMKRGTSSRLFLLGVAFVLLSSSAQAQLTRGAISGTVRDESGAVVPGASVKVTNAATSVTRDAVTDDNGFYRAGALDPGTYVVTVEKSGFSRIENRNVVVNTATEVTFDPEIKVGDVAATVDVTAQSEAISLNKTNATVGTTIETRRAVELPTGAGRNVNNLALLSPNVNASPGGSGISANGQRTRNNNFTIDGSDNNDITVTIPTTPVIPEAVSEFQIQTNPYSAENGRNTGAAINITTKSGTNEFHGTLFNYYRGSRLNALDNIEKRNGLTRPSRFNRNQFGGSIGGPVYFLNFGEGTKPIYDGRDRTFFFFLFQGDRTRSGGTLGATVRIPTPAGFAALNSVPLRAANATTGAPAQTAASRQAVLQQLGFLQGIYAQNPNFQNLQNTTVNGVAIQTGQVNIGRTSPSDGENYTFRFDHKISDNDNFTARYIYNKSDQTNVTSNLQFGSLFAGNQLLKDTNLALSEAHVFSPTLINEFRFSYIRRDLDFPENDPSTPTTGITGFFTIGGASNFPQGRLTNFYQFADTVTNTVGKHTLRFGADIRRNYFVNRAGFDTKGTFGFNNLQDFLNNNANTFTQAFSTADFDSVQTQQYYFVQDDWRATQSLTLNLGLRYETASIPFGFFGTNDPQQNAALVPKPVKRDKNNFAPVIGFAYSPRFEGDGLGAKLFGDGLTSIRGGARVAYDVLFFNILTVNAGNFPITTSVTQTNVLDVYPILAPPTTTPVFNPLATFVNSPEDLKNPESYLYSLSVQREIAKQFVFEIGYSGSRSINGINQLQLNPAILTAAQRQTVLSTGNANAIPSANARRVFPQFGQRVLIASTAQSTYNAGYVSLKRRFANNLLFDIAYTFSKTMSNNDESLGVAAITGGSPQIPQDFYNIGAEKSLSAFDRPHRFVANYLYEVPLPGFLEQNALTRALLGGFQISGITQYQSGQPFTILTGVDTNGNGQGGDRPNVNPNGIFTPDPVTGNLRTFTSPLVGGRFVVPLGANGLPLANSLGNGNLGRNTLRAPGFWNTDLSVLKRFRLPFGQDSEPHSFILRADFLNAFNQDSYGIPVNNMSSIDFGRNLNNFGNRSITLSAKYTF
jgi:outer membrane receptor protein involved in Fe transport